MTCANSASCRTELHTFPGFRRLNPGRAEAAERLTGGDAVNYATEAPFLQQLGMETIVLGPGSIDQAHQPDEYLAQDQIEPCVQLLRGLIERFCLTPARA